MTKGPRIGCAGIPARMSRSRLLEQLDILEEDALTHEPLPGARAMRRWRSQAPAESGFALLAPAAILARGEAGDAALDLVRSAREWLEAELVVLRLPSDFVPSQANRDRLRELLSGPLAADETGAGVVLLPAGLWESATLIGLADATGAIIAVDPLSGDPTGEMDALLEDQLGRGTAYLRPTKLGSRRRRCEAYELEALQDLATSLERSWVVFANPDRVKDAVALRKMIRGA